MALEAVVFPHYPFGSSLGGISSLLGFDSEMEFNQDNNLRFLENVSFDYDQHEEGNNNVSPSDNNDIDEIQLLNSTATTTPMNDDRPKRRRSRRRKNKQDIENQRMTHIAVERNRRKQMNEYLSILRSLMPDSYVQRGDQASIIGGAINYVKELEQQLQLLGAQKQMEVDSDNLVFSDCFAFPQYSTSSTHYWDDPQTLNNDTAPSPSTTRHNSIADIEVSMVESYANLKIRSRKRSKQLLKLVSGLHCVRLTILHLNVSTVEEMVLYTLSIKVEDDCKLNSVDDIATAVYQILNRIEEESIFNNKTSDSLSLP